VNIVSEAQQIVSPKDVAAVSLIYSAIRSLAECPNDRHWRQIVSESILRAEIGYLLCKKGGKISPAKGLLCGFGNRIGSAWQIASGDALSAGAIQEQLASGCSWRDAGRTVYGGDPMFVGALIMVASGIPFPEVKEILHATELSELIDVLIEEPSSSAGKQGWQSIGFNLSDKREELLTEVQALRKTGSSWQWLIAGA